MQTYVHCANFSGEWNEDALKVMAKQPFVVFEKYGCLAMRHARPRSAAQRSGTWQRNVKNAHAAQHSTSADTARKGTLDDTPPNTHTHTHTHTHTYTRTPHDRMVASPAVS